MSISANATPADAATWAAVVHSCFPDGGCFSPAVQRALHTFATTPILGWSLGPIVASFVGWSTACVVLEWVNRQPWAKRYQITYNGQPRDDAIAQTHKAVTWWQQLNRTLMFVGGPMTMIGFALNALLFPLWIPTPTTALPASLAAFAWEFALLMVTADFCLYWAHRAAHEVPLLWRFHQVHHVIGTPTAVATAYIHNVDAFVHAGPPMTICALLTCPHPVTYTIYIAYHLANAAHNHSGLDAWFLNLFTGKLLPLRTGNGHHDAHHRFANYGPHATNYGDTFVVWDWLFGSMETQQPDPTGTVCRQSTVKHAKS